MVPGFSRSVLHQRFREARNFGAAQARFVDDEPDLAVALPGLDRTGLVDLTLGVLVPLDLDLDLGLARAFLLDFDHLVIRDLELLGPLVPVVDELRALLGRYVLGRDLIARPPYAFVVDPDRLVQRVFGLGREPAARDEQE